MDLDLGGVHVVLIIEEAETGVSPDAIDGACESVAAGAFLLVAGGVEHPVPSGSARREQKCAHRAKHLPVGLAHAPNDDHLLRGWREGLDLVGQLSVDQVSTQSCCASTIAPLVAAASSSLDSAAAIRWDTGVRGTGVGSIAYPRVQLLAVCGRDEQRAVSKLAAG